MKKRKTLVLIGVAVCIILLVSLTSPVLASEDETLDIYGNANEDDTIDMRDLTYVKLIFFGKKPETELADAKYDGKINPLDFIQIKLIIVGKEKELTIVDTVDRVVTVKKPVERVVSINPRVIETMRSINAADKIVGVPNSIITDKVFFPEFCEYTNVGSSRSPDLETVLELRPDVVFLYATFSVSQSEEAQNKIESADPTIAVIRIDGYRPESFVDETEKLGYILDKREETKEFIDFYQGYMNTIEERVEKLSEEDRPKVFFEKGHYYTTGSGSGWHQDIVAAGGNNIFADLSGYPTVDAEDVILRDPKIIVVSKRGAPKPGGYHLNVEDTAELEKLREEVMNRPELQKVTAVKNGNVYIGSDYIMGGVRHFVGIGYMAKWFHPEIFEDLDPKAVHQEYITFQGLDFDLDKQGVFVYPPLPS